MYITIVKVGFQGFLEGSICISYTFYNSATEHHVTTDFKEGICITEYSIPVQSRAGLEFNKT